METYINKVDFPPTIKPNARYQCKKCDRYFPDLSAIKTHLNSKKPCDVELAILKQINEYNISIDEDLYKCKFCQYETKKRAEFTKHINRKTSCYYTTEYIDNKEIRIKNEREYLVSNGKNNKEVLELLCNQCYLNKIIKRGKGGKCLEHGGKKYEFPDCKESSCKQKGRIEGYCLEHYDLLDKDDKKFQCEKCKKVLSDNRTLNKHKSLDNCLEKLKEQEEYKETEIIIDGYKRRKCLSCDKTFKDLHGLKRHEQRNTSCIDRKLKAEKMAKYMIIDDDGKTKYECDKCNKIFDERYTCEKHIDGPRDCNPQYEIKEINNKTVIFKEKNKYAITYKNNKRIETRLCKNLECSRYPVDGHYCTEHGGIGINYYCEYYDEMDGKCKSLCKVIIDGIRYCIFHGGQPNLKKCENEECDKLIHSAKFCSKHKKNKKKQQYNEKNQEYHKNIRKKNPNIINNLSIYK